MQGHPMLHPGRLRLHMVGKTRNDYRRRTLHMQPCTIALILSDPQKRQELQALIHRTLSEDNDATREAKEKFTIDPAGDILNSLL